MVNVGVGGGKFVGSGIQTISVLSTTLFRRVGIEKSTIFNIVSILVVAQTDEFLHLHMIVFISSWLSISKYTVGKCQICMKVETNFFHKLV